MPEIIGHGEGSDTGRLLIRTPSIEGMGRGDINVDPVDVLDGLPSAVRSKVQAIRDDDTAKGAEVHAVSEKIEELREGTADHKRRLNLIEVGWGSRPDPTHFEHQKLSRELVAMERERARQQERLEYLSGVRQETRRGLRNCEAYLDGLLSGGAKISVHKGAAPSLKKGESPVEAADRERRRLQEAKAELHKTRSAPWPSDVARAKMRLAVARLSELGRPDVGGLVERLQPVRWPDAADHEFFSQYGPAAVTPGYVATLAWMFPEKLIEALNAEIGKAADDENALTESERRAREVRLLAEILSAERREEFFIVESRGACHRRGQADPRAVLGLADSLPPPREGY